MNAIDRDALRQAAAVRWRAFRKLFDDLDRLRQRLDYQTYLLAAAGLAASLLLGFGDLATRSSIAARQAEDMQATLAQVLPGDRYDNDLLRDTRLIDDPAPGGTTVHLARKSGQVTGAAFKLSALGGYSGPIALMLGVDRDGALLGVRVVAHAETPGLGDKIEAGKSGWILKFAGRSLDNTAPERWKVKKDGGDFDQFAGATITPRAVVRGVEAGLSFFRRHRQELMEGGPAAVPSPPPPIGAIEGHELLPSHPIGVTEPCARSTGKSPATACGTTTSCSARASGSARSWPSPAPPPTAWGWASPPPP
jgi:electron transport complex protein RnfG